MSRALVLTHAHLDHVLGMAVFDDVPVDAAEAGRPRWQHLLAIEWNERAVAGYGAVFPTLPDEIGDATLRMPTDWFADELDLGSESEPLVVRRTGGHTIDSSSAMVAGDGIVISGDLVQTKRHPYFGEPDTDFDAWIGALRGWEEVRAKAVCPGHGPVIGGEELAVIRSWFEAFASSVKELKAGGLSLDEVITSDQLPPGYWPAEDSVPRWWGSCVKRVYDSM